MHIVDLNVYVQFRPNAGTNEAGLPYSWEPRKWVRVLSTDARPYGMRCRIDAYGLSEYPNSLNLRLRLHPGDLIPALRNIANVFTGAEAVHIFNPIPGVTPEMIRTPNPVSELNSRRQAA